jgi:hypothetical protein
MTPGDRFYDFSLRLLMLALGAALIGCLVWLAWRWSQPPAGNATVVPVTQVAPKVERVPVKDVAGKDAPQQVLLAPGQVFKCQNGGKVTFTDRPCPTETR